MEGDGLRGPKRVVPHAGFEPATPSLRIVFRNNIIDLDETRNRWTLLDKPLAGIHFRELSDSMGYHLVATSLIPRHYYKPTAYRVPY